MSKMSKTLLTRCPACDTTFSVTNAHMAARSGLVRCGRCATVFQAKHQLVEPAAANNKRQSKTTARAKATRVSNRKRSGNEPGRVSKKQTTQPAPALTVEEDIADTMSAEEFVTPALARIFLGNQQPRTRLVLWGLAALLLLVTLLAQSLYFYASELARQPQLGPWVAAACQHLGCVVRPRQDVTLIELLRTHVGPHPQRSDALRIRTSMVNRAGFAQPYPLMELTLTTSNGEIAARRTFLPQQYLGRAALSERMAPYVVVDGVLDITRPNTKSAGFEIRLVALQ
jgi:predicted Zn finger-like uncharacterized protein